MLIALFIISFILAAFVFKASDMGGVFIVFFVLLGAIALIAFIGDHFDKKATKKFKQNALEWFRSKGISDPHEIGTIGNTVFYQFQNRLCYIYYGSTYCKTRGNLAGYGYIFPGNNTFSRVIVDTGFSEHIRNNEVRKQAAVAGLLGMGLILDPSSNHNCITFIGAEFRSKLSPGNVFIIPLSAGELEPSDEWIQMINSCEQKVWSILRYF